MGCAVLHLGTWFWGVCSNVNSSVNRSWSTTLVYQQLKHVHFLYVNLMQLSDWSIFAEYVFCKLPLSLHYTKPCLSEPSVLVVGQCLPQFPCLHHSITLWMQKCKTCCPQLYTMACESVGVHTSETIRNVMFYPFLIRTGMFVVYFVIIAIRVSCQRSSKIW